MALVVSSIGIMISALIAFTAVSGPSRDRYTRDLEIRKARARLNERAAQVTMRALDSIDNVERYFGRRRLGRPYEIEDVGRFVDRCKMRDRVIRHYLSLKLRDRKLVTDMTETSQLLKTLDSKLSNIYAIHHQHPQLATNQINQFLDYKVERRRAIRIRLLATSLKMLLKDQSLQQDLDRVWSIHWYWPFNRRNLIRTDRD